MIKYHVFLMLLSYYAAEAIPDAGFLPPEFLAAVKPLRDTCLQKSGSTDKAIQEFINSKGPGKQDEKLKAYMTCIFIELQLVAANGDVMLEKLFQMLPDSTKDIVSAMAKDCMNLQGNNVADKIWWLHQCWKKADPVHYFIV